MKNFPATLVYEENTDHDAWVEVDVDSPEALREAVAVMKGFLGANPIVTNDRGDFRLATALRWKKNT